MPQASDIADETNVVAKSNLPTQDTTTTQFQSASELLGFDISDFSIPFKPTSTTSSQGIQFSALERMLEIVKISIPWIFDSLDELRMHFNVVETLLAPSVVAAVQDVLRLSSNQADVKLPHRHVTQRQIHQNTHQLLDSSIVDAKEQKQFLDDLIEARSRLDSPLSGLKAEKKRLEEELYKINSQIQAIEEQASALTSRVQAQKNKAAMTVATITKQLPPKPPVPGDDEADRAILDSTKKFLDAAASAIAAALPQFNDCNHEQ